MKENSAWWGGVVGGCCHFRRSALSGFGIADEKVMDSIYRRFMRAVYHQRKLHEHARSFKLSRDARTELIVLALLAPLCLNDLKVFPDPSFDLLC